MSEQPNSLPTWTAAGEAPRPLIALVTHQTHPASTSLVLYVAH